MADESQEVDSEVQQDGVLKDEQSEEPKEEQSQDEKVDEPSLSDVANMAKATQQGYTQTTQRLARIEEALEKLADVPSQQPVQTSEGDDDYVTAGKLKSLLREELAGHQQQQQTEQAKKEAYINQAFDDLYATGVLSDKSEEKAFIELGTKLGMGDPKQIAPVWQEVQAAKGVKAKKEVVEKKQEKQKEGAKVGSSEKSQSSSMGIDYNKIRNNSFGDLSSLFIDD